MNNIKYEINSDTGSMRLKFDKSIINLLSKDKQKIFNDYILAMLAMNNKLVLTGSLSLKLMGFEKMDDFGDLDFGLSDHFTEEDYTALKNFFQLRNTKDEYHWDLNNEKEIKEYKFNPNDRLWQFTKSWTENEEIDNELNITNVKSFKIDIFNDEILRDRDILSVYWDDFEIKLIHPSVTYSYRMRYALDIRGGTAYKYWERMKNFMDNAKEYYHNIRSIQNMSLRVQEHNTSIENDKNKLYRLRQLIANRENNMDSFIDKIFK